jgi:hypothetical protein
MCSQRVKSASLRAGKSSLGAETIAGAPKRRADRCEVFPAVGR